jgi:hypothetical protein
MAIPMSPDQVMKKRYGIFIHQSQKDMVPFMGDDSRNSGKGQKKETVIPQTCMRN